MTDLRGTASRFLGPRTSVLVIVDPQARLMPAIFEADRVVRNCVLLLRLSRILCIPAVVTTQYAHGLGPVVPEISSEVPETGLLDKTSFGCFGDGKFAAHLKEVGAGRKTLLVAGVESHICVTQTVLGSLEAGYDVHVAGDAHPRGLARIGKPDCIAWTAQGLSSVPRK